MVLSRRVDVKCMGMCLGFVEANSTQKILISLYHSSPGTSMLPPLLLLHRTLGQAGDEVALGEEEGD